MKFILKLIVFLLGIGLILFFFKYDFKNEESFSSDDVYVFPPFSEIYKFRPVYFDSSEISNNFEKFIFDKRLRKRLFESANMMTKPDKNPKINVIHELDRGSYIEQKLNFIIYPATISYAYLLVPKNVSFSAPLILAMHPHGGFYEYGKEAVVGNKGDKEWAYGKELAERGYVVLTMDAPLFGDRTLGNLPNQNSPETLEDFGSQSLISLGHSLLGEVLREDISILNLISSLKNIDQNKIGCIGHSFGGVRCIYLSAMDERIKVVVLANSVANLRRNYRDGILQSWFTIMPGVAKYTDTNGILGLIATRPLMVLSSENDPIFPLKEAKTQIESVKEMYENLNKKENLNFTIIKNGEHTFPEEYRRKAYDFFDKYFKK